MIALLTLVVAARSALADKKVCTRVVASAKSYRELHVVGKRQCGQTRAILLIGDDTKGYVVQPGECVGRERVSFEQLFPSPQPTGDFELRPPHDG